MYIKKIISEGKTLCIYLSDNEFFSISESVFVRFNLYKGKELSEEEILEVKRNNKNQKAIDFILPKIANRKTCFEVENLLRKGSFDDISIEYAIAYLKRYGFIDDDEYAKLFVRDKMNLNKYGPIKIKYILRKKGITKETIKKAMKEYDKESIYRNILSLISKKYNSPDLSDPNFRNRCIRYLLQRGFLFEDISNAIDWSKE